MKRQEWVELGKRRITNILQKHLYASIRQLEIKISEAGPTNQRAEPHIITSALQEMRLNDRSIGYDDADKDYPRYYFLRGHFDQRIASHDARRAEVRRLQLQFKQLSSNTTLCGDALETVIWATIKGLPSTYLPLGAQGRPVEVFGNIRLPGSLDFTLLLNDKPCLIAGEAKNIREWIYPEAHELWGLIGKAARLLDYTYPVVPVFVARKISYAARVFMSTAGILGFETHKQYFAPAAHDDLVQIRHKDGLGFHDILTDLAPTAPLQRFLGTTVPQYGLEYAERFRSKRTALVRYAVEYKLEDNKMDGRDRSSLLRDFKKNLGMPEDDE